MFKARAAIVVIALGMLTIGFSGCMQAINANAGYNSFESGTLMGINSGTSTNYLYYPRGMAVDSSGKIFVVDGGHNRIVEMSSISSTSWTSWPTTSTTVQDLPSSPEGIAVSGTGVSTSIWIADSGNGRILHLYGWPNPSSIIAYTATTSNIYNFSYPVGLALSSTGTTLYVTDPGFYFPSSTPSVYEITVNATGTSFIGVASATSFGSALAHAPYPRGIAVGSGGVYITDESNYRIIQMNTGLTSVLATLGTRGSGTWQFISPQTIAVDSTNHIYVGWRRRPRRLL